MYTVMCLCASVFGTNIFRVKFHRVLSTHDPLIIFVVMTHQHFSLTTGIFDVTESIPDLEQENIRIFKFITEFKFFSCIYIYKYRTTHEEFFLL